MNPTSKAKRWTEGDARRELKGWRQSGESMAGYARKRGYDAQRLHWWRTRLEGEATSERRTLALAPVVVRQAGRGTIAITISTGAVRLEVEDPTTVHPAWIAEVASALRGGVTA